VVIKAYNEIANIDAAIGSALSMAEGFPGLAVEVVVADGQSSDGTATGCC
jgi:glycosyltransferase involved in cell wall biosynthesis